MTKMPALLKLGGAPLIGGTAPLAIEVTSKAERSLTLVGNWLPLFATLAGEARAPRGALEIAGEDGRDLVLDLRLGLLRSSAQWPASYTVAEVLELSTRLLGRSLLESKALAKEALESLGILALAKQRLERLRFGDRRLVELAHALLGKPEILALENPLWGLEGEDRERFAKAVAIVRAERKTLVSVANLSGDTWDQGLVQGAEEIFILHEGLLTWQGSPAAFARSQRLYVMTLAGKLDPVVSELGRRGVVVRSSVPTSAIATLAEGRLVVELPADLSTRALLEAAQAGAATLLELRSLDDVR
jgi:ABC-type multidrug transport system ATPase subunit